MPHGVRLGEVFQAYQTGTRPWGRPRTRWRDYIFHLAPESLGILPTRPKMSWLRFGSITPTLRSDSATPVLRFYAGSSISIAMIEIA